MFSFLASWAIIFQQVLVGPVDGRVLALAGALLGIPGLGALWPRILLALSSTGTTSSDSESAESDSRS